jgi:hypothetical protein
VICYISINDVWEVLYKHSNHIDGVIVSVLVSSALDRWFEPRSGQAKDYKIGSCCFSTKHTALSRKSKDWLARNQDNVFEWDDMSTRDCCFSELAL